MSRDNAFFFQLPETIRQRFWTYPIQLMNQLRVTHATLPNKQTEYEQTPFTAKHLNYLNRYAFVVLHFIALMLSRCEAAFSKETSVFIAYFII